MTARNEQGPGSALIERKSGFEEDAKTKDSLDFGAIPLGQNCPKHCPQPEDELGEPMDIREVAILIGCSVWTIRQRYLPSGLPHFRLSSHGKLVFYRHQVIRWVLERQRQKGGTQWPFGSAAGSTGRRCG
jgi:hypothetical protein